jgi:hypothetical protein
MAVEFEAITIGVAVIVVILIRSKIRMWKRMRAIDAQLTKMQKEIYMLQLHESRRLMTALGENSRNSKVEAPKIDPDNGPLEIDSDHVVRLVKTPPTTPA